MAAPELVALQLELGLTGMEVVPESALQPTARMQKNTQAAGYDISMMPRLEVN